MRYASVILLAALALGGCQSSDSASGDAPTDAEKQALSHGYAQLYQTVNGLSGIDNVLLVKTEAEPVEAYIKDLAEQMGQLAGRLENALRPLPWIDLDDNGLPEIERAKRASAQWSRIVGFAPLVGRTGADFERALLLTLSGGLNQSRHLIRALAEREDDADREAMLDEAEAVFDQLYEADVELLNARYFCSS